MGRWSRGAALRDRLAVWGIRSGGTVALFGDSITQQGLWSEELRLMVESRLPALEVLWINAGLSGNTASSAKWRLAPEVLDAGPDAVLVQFGMNDAGYGAFDARRLAA